MRGRVGGRQLLNTSSYLSRTRSADFSSQLLYAVPQLPSPSIDPLSRQIFKLAISGTKPATRIEVARFSFIERLRFQTQSSLVSRARPQKLKSSKGVSTPGISSVGREQQRPAPLGANAVFGTMGGSVFHVRGPLSNTPSTI